jgi:hypothetical protein
MCYFNSMLHTPFYNALLPTYYICITLIAVHRNVSPMQGHRNPNSENFSSSGFELLSTLFLERSVIQLSSFQSHAFNIEYESEQCSFLLNQSDIEISDNDSSSRIIDFFQIFSSRWSI